MSSAPVTAEWSTGGVEVLLCVVGRRVAGWTGPTDTAGASGDLAGGTPWWIHAGSVFARPTTWWTRVQVVHTPSGELREVRVHPLLRGVTNAETPWR